MNGLGLYIAAVLLPILFGIISIMRIEHPRARRWSTLYFTLSTIISFIYVLTAFFAAEAGNLVYGLVFYLALLCLLVQVVAVLAVKKSNIKRALGVNLVTFAIISFVFLEIVLIQTF